MLKVMVALGIASVILMGGYLIDVLGAAAGSAPVRPRSDTAAGDDRRALLPIVAIPGLDPERVELGRRIFHETRLSHDGSLSCASCHQLVAGGMDGRRVSRGVGGLAGVINAPTVYNAALSFRQFWDGRAATLEDQVGGPIANPLEMASSWPEAVAALAADPGYVAAFARLYPEGISPTSISAAVATFERTLVTSGSRCDRFLGGERTALTDREQAGFRLFLTLGCSSCHQGAGIGGNLYQRFGLMEDYFGNRGNETAADLGRFAVTQREADRHVFKVPSLRNVALTAPYFHDGTAKTLEQAVAVMARYELGTRISEDDIGLLVAFLRTLTGPSLEGTP